MSVLCGNHKVHDTATTHETVADVRACFFGPEAGPEVVTAPPGPRVTPIVKDGTYTVTRPDGHTTLRLKTQPLDADFAPGQQIAAYLSGPDNTSDYVSFAFVGEHGPKVWRRFQSDTLLVEALITAIEGGDNVLVSAACFRCGKELTTPESLATGFGPTCASKGLRG